MKHFYLLLLFFTSHLNAQKQDYLWLNCHTYGQPDGTQLNFNYDPVQIDVVQRQLYMTGTNASICDSDGNLLLYTNGRSIANFEDEIIENGDSINYGFWYDNFGDAGYPAWQGAFFIQKPDNEHLYYLFHSFVGFENGPAPVPKSLWYSIIDMEANNGKGKVLEKNVPLLQATEAINYTEATAVRHANGRDWWIIVPSHMGPQYYRFLLTPNGIEGPWEQEIGFLEPTTDFFKYGRTNKKFSPEGSKYAEYILDFFIQVFDFDRCTGLFSNPRLIPNYNDPNFGNGGGNVAFSPNSKLLYITSVDGGYTLMQYNTEVDDVASTESEIYYCPFVNLQPTCGLIDMLLAPDGKIYVGLDSNSYSIIHEPDNLGLACNFELKGLIFPVPDPIGRFPYWPNYRLGVLEGSGCDTIVSKIIDSLLKKETFDVYPNPASDKLFFASPKTFTGMISIKLLNSTGQLVSVMAQAQWGGSISMPLQQAAPGLYFYEIDIDGVAVQQGKLVVVR
jgi:Secretion system C-terminal sorting domain